MCPTLCVMYTLVQPGWHGTDSLSHDHVSYVMYDVHIGSTRLPWHEADSLSHDHVSYVMYDVHIGSTRLAWDRQLESRSCVLRYV
jgi:hypothetical protein